MVRTGARAAALQQLLFRAGLQPAAIAPPSPRLDELSTEAQSAVIAVYDVLGGLQPMQALRPGAWDLSFDGGLVIELDEELHFNRYRITTLQPAVSTKLPWRDAYLDFCTRYEAHCLQVGRWGKRWTSPSCEAMFGPAGETGALQEAGAPRWKQRALYDAIKDIAASDSQTWRLARLSVWDNVGGIRLGDALSEGAPIDVSLLRALVTRRATSRTGIVAESSTYQPDGRHHEDSDKRASIPSSDTHQRLSEVTVSQDPTVHVDFNPEHAALTFDDTKGEPILALINWLKPP
ncbi:hypothetical protein [Mycobacterium sp. shizuoka-1]|uniref:DUF7255 family protein n=1 Tax=Mycobacterium sp. shizuoka-1 TaxID=2039281 RepID=UPI0018EAE88D|nr:hypothetical protein [Mycobacterium sp. shizuoka-1]